MCELTTSVGQRINRKNKTIDFIFLFIFLLYIFAVLTTALDGSSMCKDSVVSA